MLSKKNTIKHFYTCEKDSDQGLDDKKILGAGILKLLLLPAWPSTSNSWPQTGKTWETNGNQ